ncbi:ABC transporter ATP-binding protein/permease [Halobacillus shinanisalinarum]|uniref:ABC transporter ATP-binding protein/permease n=1 Tax=Halobacillus shinanisalinarum TaxID=2932258 RepID=A0ABY4H5A8_9BACI|nr:ABC transporter ATP-binding protein [Halobacillus shinanisalinarum]UOQ95309.1 ABC transporter ATP-binding protein/permease [Halobacillus shinanisalinarum]
MMKLFKFLKPYRIPIIVILVLTLLQSLSQLFLPALMANVVDKGIVNGDISYIVKIGGFMLLVAAGGVVFSILAGFYSSKVSMGFGKIIREKMFTHIENFSLQGFDKVGASSLITRTTNDIMQVQQVLTMMLKVLIMAPMMFIGGIFIAVATDAAMSLIIIAVVPIIVAAIIVVAKKGLPLFKALQKKLDRLNLVLREGLNGIRVIRSFNRTTHERNRFNEANLDFANTAIKVNKIMATLTPIMMFVLNFSIIAIIWFGSIRISNGNLQVGELMAFIQYAMQIMFSLIMSSMMLIMIPRASVSASRINEVLDTVSEAKDPVEDKHGRRLEGFVEFDHVTFSYPGAEEPVLSNISFSTKPGEVTAIVGGTGAGKSTLINLLPRFYDVDHGTITIDGIDTRDMSQSNLRNNISFAPQKSVLFSGTIADNIRYGKKMATDKEVRKAADVAQVSDFILETKNGFDSVIAQKGANVSGGQKQRLSIARALIRKASIYIFDDSFSALDFKTDAKLRASLQEETSDSTVFIVAQRISTVMDADQIIVLDHGEMAGVGTHQELMESCEIYQEIVSSQLSEEETA